MKLILHWATRAVAFLILGLGLASCLREHRDNEDSLGEGREIHVELSTAFGEEALRLAQNVDQSIASSSGDVRAGQTTTPAMSDKNLSVYIAVKRGGNVQYQTKEFQKVAGENRVVYRGKLTIPKGGTGEYNITAIVLREVGDGGVEYASLDPVSRKVTALPVTELIQAQNGVVQTKGPYVASSTFTLPDGATTLNNCTLHFEPSGMLLRVQIHNATAAEKSVSSVKLRTNAFFSSWMYSLADLTGGNLLKGEVANPAEWEKEYTLPSPITLAANAYSDIYYLWVMPRKNVEGLSTSWTIDGQSVFERNSTTTSPAALPEGQGRMLLAISDAAADVCPGAFDYLKLFAGFAQRDNSTPKLYNEQMFARTLEVRTPEDMMPLVNEQDNELRFAPTRPTDATLMFATRIVDKTIEDVKREINAKYGNNYHIPSMEEWGLIFPTTDPGQFNPLRDNLDLCGSMPMVNGVHQFGAQRGNYSGLGFANLTAFETYHPFVWMKANGGWPFKFYSEALDLMGEQPHYIIPYLKTAEADYINVDTREERIFNPAGVRLIADYFPIPTSDTTTVFNFAGHNRTTEAEERVSFDGGATVETVTSYYDFTPRLTKRPQEPYPVEQMITAPTNRPDGKPIGYEWRTTKTAIRALRFSDGANNCRRIAVQYEMVRDRLPVHPTWSYPYDYDPQMKNDTDQFYVTDSKLTWYNPLVTNGYRQWWFLEYPDGSRPFESGFPEAGDEISWSSPQPLTLKDANPRTANDKLRFTRDVNYMVVKIKKIGSDPTIRGVSDILDTHFDKPDVTLVFPIRADDTRRLPPHEFFTGDWDSSYEYSWRYYPEHIILTPGNTYWVSNKATDGTQNWITWAWGGIRAGTAPGYNVSYGNQNHVPVFLFHGAPKN